MLVCLSQETLAYAYATEYEASTVTQSTSEELLLELTKIVDSWDLTYQNENIAAAVSAIQNSLRTITERSVEPVKIEEFDDSLFQVPFYSQFLDITAPEWQKVGCGIASLAMLIDFYSSDSVDVNELLHDGVSSGAYLESAGWIHAGLIGLSHSYGLDGESHSLAQFSMDEAFQKLVSVLDEGPVMASVHYTFEPTNPIPHLVVVTGVQDEVVFYNDPAETSGGGQLSIEKFKQGWKKRYVEIRPL